MSTLNTILAARALLREVTPLKGDCGRRCDAACCQPDEEGNGGMLLLPGEETLYAARTPWATITPSGLYAGGAPLAFLTCEGTCPREERPLACRVFPLTPALRDGAATVELDTRAWPVCPLMPHGVAGLSRQFVAAVRSVSALLCEDAALRDWLRVLTEQMDAFRSF